MRMKWSYGYTVLFLSWSGWICIYMSRSVLPPLLPILFEELGMSHAQGGLLETAYLLGYIAVKIPAGLVADRIGIKMTLIVGVLGYAVSSALNFFASSFAHLFALRFLLGFFQGVHLPLANTLLSERFGADQGRVIGFHESGPNVGATIALPLTVAISAALGWRHAFLLLSLPAFILAGAVALMLKEEEPGSMASGFEGSTSFSALREYTSILAPLALAHSVYNLCVRNLMIFAPAYLVEYRSLSFATAGLIAMLMPAAGFLAKVSSGFVGERVGENRTIISAMGVTGLLIFSLTYVGGEYGLLLDFVLMGLVLYSFSPVIYSSVTRFLPGRLKPLGLGVVTMVGNTTGAFSTYLMGYAIDSVGYQVSLRLLSATVLLLTLVVLYAMRRRG
jgi:MFS family permease